MFGDYMNPDAEAEERVYDEIKSLDEMYTVVEQCLDEYNNTHKNRMNLVIFRSDGEIIYNIFKHAIDLNLNKQLSLSRIVTRIIIIFNHCCLHQVI